MTLVLARVGAVLALKALLNLTAGQDQTLKLYQNNITPADTDTAATYTESTFAGYAAKALTGASWNFASGTPSSATRAATETFTRNATGAAENCYGYFLIQTTSGTLLWSERFTGAPYPLSNNGDNIQLVPAITLG